MEYISVDLHNKETTPHKKPLVRQFKSFQSGGTLSTFKSAGTLGSSFISSSSSADAVVSPPVCSETETDKLEVEQYKAYIEGRIESPTERLPPPPDDDDSVPEPAAEPKIVFKRAADNSDDVTSPPKKAKAEEDDEEPPKNPPAGEDEASWDPSNYGYQCNNQPKQFNQQSRGRAWRGSFDSRGGFSKTYFNYGRGGGGYYNNRGGGGYGYGGYGYRGGW